MKVYRVLYGYATPVIKNQIGVLYQSYVFAVTKK